LKRNRFGIHIKSYILNVLTVIFLSAAFSGVNALLSDVVNMANVMRYLRSPLLFAINTLPLTLVMAFTILKEHMTTFQLFGVMLIVAATVLLHRNESRGGEIAENPESGGE
jgi:drug/metabolite transporter (DMT)-like permease